MVRLSGPSARHICTVIVSLKPELYPRRATLGELIDDNNRTIDEVVVTWFVAPHSSTGDDVVEISCHGAPVILRYALGRAVHAGARLADPGEFTLRAFLNGRIDLPQAEAIRDLIEATTLYQARIAAQQAQGSVSRRLAPIKAQLLELIALLEAGIDFAEDDVSVAPASEILRRLNPILDQTSALARSFRYGNLVRAGFSLAIVGPPNAGKSSLFNRLLDQDRAIVTDIPGTTRDVVSETAEFSGIPVRILDTAGIRDTHEPVERLGMARSFEAMSDADLTIVVVDGASLRSGDACDLIAKAREQGRCLIVANKCDLFDLPRRRRLAPRICPHRRRSRHSAFGDSRPVRPARTARNRRRLHHQPAPGKPPRRSRYYAAEGQECRVAGNSSRASDPRSLLRSFTSRRHYRRHHRRRYSESHFQYILYRQVGYSTALSEL